MFRPAPHFDGLPSSHDGLLRTGPTEPNSNELKPSDDATMSRFTQHGGSLLTNQPTESVAEKPEPLRPEMPARFVLHCGDLPTSENSQSALFKPRSEYHRADRLDDPLANYEGGGLPNCLLLAAPYRVPARMNHAPDDEAQCRVDRALRATASKARAIYLAAVFSSRCRHGAFSACAANWTSKTWRASILSTPKRGSLVRRKSFDRNPNACSRLA